MSYFRRFSPFHAIKDLRAFLSQRQPYEVGFLFLAIAVTWLVMSVMLVDTREEKEYRPEIVYVEQWPATRTDAEIAARQKIDGVEQTKRENEEKRRAAEERAAYKRLDDQLTRLGI